MKNELLLLFALLFAHLACIDRNREVYNSQTNSETSRIAVVIPDPVSVVTKYETGVTGETVSELTINFYLNLSCRRLADTYGSENAASIMASNFRRILKEEQPNYKKLIVDKNSMYLKFLSKETDHEKLKRLGTRVYRGLCAPPISDIPRVSNAYTQIAQYSMVS
ncbi:MAG: hypothetical protein HYT70_02035 [Candidatus Aenigmarchaeota archaeon]|nr:hypothetical protein [Candidatus Aenigmarchaeota archaeon]